MIDIENNFIKIDKKLSLSFGLVIVLVLLSVFFASIFYFNYVVTKEQNRYGSVIANAIGTAINSVSFSGKYQARLLITNLKKQNENIDSIIIQDASGLVIGHTDVQYNGKIIDDQFFQKAKDVMKTKQYIIQEIEILKDGKTFKYVEIDIPYKKGYDNQIVGVSRVLLLSDSFDKLKLNGLIYLLGLIFVLVVISYILVQRISDYFSKSIKNLAIRLDSLINSIPDLVWMKDENGVYLHCNKRFEDFFGAKHDEIVGKTDFDFVDKKLADFFRKHDKNAMKASHPVENFEEVTFASDGHKEYLQTIKTAVKDSTSHIIGVLGVGRDITTIQEQNKKLVEQKEEFETIFNTSKDGIAILDLESKFLDCNQAYLDMTGFSKEELLTKSCIELTVSEEVQKSKDVIQIVKEQGYFENFEKTCLIAYGETLQVNMSLALMPDKKRILISTKNVTGLKILEQQAKLVSMGEMIGNIAHQWRQPLSIISTSATGMLFQKQFDTLNDEDLIKYCNFINDNAQYLSKTIDDFRNFIKGDSQKITFNVTETINSFLQLVDGSIKNNHIKLILDLDDRLNIYSYPNELIQCLMNIYNNAKDVLKELSEEDRLLFISTEEENRNVIITFKDSGGGIDENIINKIFEPYFTTKHKSQGTGLGLHMTYKLIVDGMGGLIEVSNTMYNYEEKQYTGAQFTITLPLS